MMQEGKVGPTIHKNPITSEQLQQLYETGQLDEWDTVETSRRLRTAWFYITFYFGKWEGQKAHPRHWTLVLRSTPQRRRYYAFRSPWRIFNSPSPSLFRVSIQDGACARVWIREGARLIKMFSLATSRAKIRLHCGLLCIQKSSRWFDR